MFNLTVGQGLGQIHPSALLAWGLGSWPIARIPTEEVIYPPISFEDLILEGPYLVRPPLPEFMASKKDLLLADGKEILLAGKDERLLVRDHARLIARTQKGLRERQSYDRLLVEAHDRPIGGKR